MLKYEKFDTLTYFSTISNFYIFKYLKYKRICKWYTTEATMDGLKNGMEDKMDGMEEKMEGLKEYMEGLKEGLSKLIQEDS